MNPLNPTEEKGEVNDLPSDAVALLIWCEYFGPQPLTIVVSKQSWEMNQKVVYNAGYTFNPDRIYEFESPINQKGRKTIFQFQKVVGWAANIDTGVIPAKT